MPQSLEPGVAGHTRARDLCAIAIVVLTLNNARAQEAKPVEQIVVTGTAIAGDYAATDAGTGTKTDTPLMQTPLSVQVVPQQVLLDQKVTSIDQALKNVSGVTVGGGGAADNGQGFSSIKLRGFFTDAHFRNGVRLDSFGSDSGTYAVEFANVDRVEVLKGPAAILYGMVEPGGMVNIVTKEPLGTPYYAVEQQIGSYDTYRTAVDATGPLSHDTNWRYRVDASREDSGSSVDLVYNKSTFFAPVVTWRPGAADQLKFEYELRNKEFGQSFGFQPLLNGALVNSDPTVNFGEHSPDFERTHLEGIGWSHQFNDQWSLHQQILANHIQTDGTGFYPYYVCAPGDAVALASDGSTACQPGATGPAVTSGATVGRFINQVFQNVHTFSLNEDLTGHFQTAGLRHTLLVGADFVRFTDNGGINQIGQLDADVSYISLSSPVHPGTAFSGQLTPYIASYSKTDTAGIYLQDQLSLPYGLHLLAGLRRQYVRQTGDFGFAGGPMAPNPSLTARATTPRVGLLWQASSSLSLYGNYAENFGPNNGYSLTVDGTMVPPTSAHQWELGVKARAFGGKLLATLAYFDLTKTNIPTPDPANPGFVLVTGAARSRGWELDVQGQVLPGWNVIANYANTDARVSSSNDANNPVGTLLGEIPRNLLHLWTTYEFRSGLLQGFKIGGGATYNGPEPYLYGALYGGNPDARIPGYTVFDLMASCNFKLGRTRLTAQLNANNVLDRKYFSDIQSAGFPADGPYSSQTALYGAARSILGSLKVEI
jgi:iron complex outermembrane receptor protein